MFVGISSNSAHFHLSLRFSGAVILIEKKFQRFSKQRMVSNAESCKNIWTVNVLQQFPWSTGASIWVEALFRQHNVLSTCYYPTRWNHNVVPHVVLHCTMCWACATIQLGGTTCPLLQILPAIAIIRPCDGDDGGDEDYVEVPVALKLKLKNFGISSLAMYQDYNHLLPYCDILLR